MRMTFSGVVLGYLAGKFPHVSCIHWISLAYAGTHFMEVPDNFWPKNWRRRFPEKNGGPADLKNMVATSNLPSSNSTYSYGKWTIDDLPTKHHDLPYSSITTWHWRKLRVQSLSFPTTEPFVQAPLYVGLQHSSLPNPGRLTGFQHIFLSEIQEANHLPTAFLGLLYLSFAFK